MFTGKVELSYLPNVWNVEGYLMYIAYPINNGVPEALFTLRGVGGPGVCSPENFLILGLQKWRFLDFEYKFPITSVLNVVGVLR